MQPKSTPQGTPQYDRQTAGISRRTIAKGAAWAVPAITLTTAPLVAATEPPIKDCLTWTLSASACKWPGAGSKWSYKVGFRVCNTCPNPIDIVIDSMANNSGKALTGCDGTIIGQTVSIPANDCVDLPTYAYSSSSSAHSIDIFGHAVGSTKTILVGSVDAPVQDCTGTSPCA